jgi:hypothetical protein
MLNRGAIQHSTFNIEHSTFMHLTFLNYATVAAYFTLVVTIGERE